MHRTHATRVRIQPGPPDRGLSVRHRLSILTRLWHYRAVPAEPPLDLSAIRHDIDDVDRRLVSLLAERQRLVDRVVVFKRSHHMGVVDRGREDEMLAAIAVTATEAGLDPRVAQHVLRTIIDGFTLLEVEELGPEGD
jgi:chorismate mutase